MAIIIASISLFNCTPKANYDLVLTIVPASPGTGAGQDEMNAVAEVIIKRLNNSLGIPVEKIQYQAAPSQISMTIPDTDSSDINTIRKVIADNSKLEFRETYDNSELSGNLKNANDLLKHKGVAGAGTDNPLLDLLTPRIKRIGNQTTSSVIGIVSADDTSLVSRYLNMPEIKALFPPDLNLMWSQKPYEYIHSGSYFELHAIRLTGRNGSAPLDGRAVASASVVKGPDASDIRINLTMNPEGRTRWAEITRNNIGKCIAVVVNGHVRSYPRVMDEISGGNTEITGDFTAGEAGDLVNILNSGYLPFKIKLAGVEVK